MSQRRDDILELCITKLQGGALQTREETKGEIGVVLDEIILALRDHRDGTRTSPLPEKSAAAARHGKQRQHLAYSIECISRDFGSISDSVGELASAAGLHFPADEYRIFNLCVDASIACALEEYWTEAIAQEHRSTTERVGVFAHELRNAVASARMSYSLLETGQFAVKSRVGDVLGRALARIEVLVGRAILEVQVDRHLEPQRKTVRVAELLRVVRDSVVRERGVTVVVNAEESIEAAVDERLLSSAVTNLVQNGVKFTCPNGTVTVRATLAGADLCIEVEDECGGLSPEIEEKMFRPFVRSPVDRRGLGLGLNITREAVEVHGGRLSVKNLPGKGCVFCAFFPTAAV